jgi:mannosyl-3-phosphoglycerate phosphatase
MKVVFTDLDGTLLDHQTYSFEPARAAIERLRRLAIPWILVTSKTRAETEFWRTALGNDHPFVVENGAAAILPAGYFGASAPERLEWGRPYAELVAALEEAAREARCPVRGFHQMSVEEVAAACGLPLEQAALARQREYDEPFELLDASREAALVEALSKRGVRVSRGGRFYHATGPADKGQAVLALKRLYEAARGPVTTIGLGDAMNDLAFLRVVDVPVVIRSGQAFRLLEELAGARLTEQPGPAGWNAAVLELARD